MCRNIFCEVTIPKDPLQLTIKLKNTVKKNKHIKENAIEKNENKKENKLNKNKSK